MEEYKIEKGIPIPGRLPFEKMEVGDSFFTPCKTASHVCTLKNYWLKKSGSDWEFISRAEEQDGKKGARTWRIK